MEADLDWKSPIDGGSEATYYQSLGDGKCQPNEILTEMWRRARVELEGLGF
jgi:hypothetical protein